jgi:hypothetical protein
MTKQFKITLGVAAVALAGALVVSVQVDRRAAEAKQQAAAEAAKSQAFADSLVKIHEAYMKPVPVTEKLSTLPTAQKAAFTHAAAQTFAVEETTAQPATPPEVVGACMRQKNLEFAASYKDQSTATVLKHDVELRAVKQMIAQDCYVRYSSDGRVPAKLTEAMPSH